MEITEDLWWKSFEKYAEEFAKARPNYCLLYTSPSPRDRG